MDDLDELLTPGAAVPDVGDGAWRATAAVLRRRRWIGHARRTTAMAACVAVGATAMAWWSPRPVPPVSVEIVEVVREPEAPVDDYRDAAPEALERRARHADGARRIALMRQAGDGYLQQGNELAALRCYRQTLTGPAAELAIDAERDNWLLISMKLARQKEKTDARN